MQVERSSSCFGGSLRTMCLIIGYLCLIASIVDTITHFVVLAIISNGFECDIYQESTQLINWTWLEPFLLIVNMGTHGFYPYPLILRPYALAFDKLPNGLERNCYPGMLHVYMGDVLNFLINVIWFKIVFAYIVAMYKRDIKPIRVFYMMTILKIVVQTVFLAFQPDTTYFSNETLYFLLDSRLLKLMDIALSSIFVVIIGRYSVLLMQERVLVTVPMPPTYEECLKISNQNDEKKDAIVNIDTKPQVCTSSN